MNAIATPAGPDARIRCAWGDSPDPAYRAYHDEEWGVPVRDERHLFELLILEGAQAGLSWSTILRKREGYRKAFAGFDPRKVARFRPQRGPARVRDLGSESAGRLPACQATDDEDHRAPSPPELAEYED